jgi:hypothetical protein
MTAPFRPSRALRGAAKLRQAASSVAPVASGYERSLRPTLTRFSRPEDTSRTEGGL